MNRISMVHRYADALYRWAWARMGGNPDAAEELVQRSFLSAFERPRAYDPARGEPWGWLLGLAMNHLKAMRRERRRGFLVPRGEPVAFPEDPLDVEESRLKVRLALTELPPEVQRLLEGHYVEGKPVEHLAEEAGIAPSTAWARLAQAREMFRKVLKEAGDEHA